MYCICFAVFGLFLDNFRLSLRSKKSFCWNLDEERKKIMTNTGYNAFSSPSVLTKRFHWIYPSPQLAHHQDNSK